jgi:hypothetical protein
VDLVAAFGLDFHDVLHVHDTEGDVPALVLRGKAEHALVDLSLREHLAHAEQRLHKAFADQMQR